MVRIVGMFLAAIPLFAGYLPILINDKRQGFHDKLAKTVVRYRKPEPARRRLSLAKYSSAVRVFVCWASPNSTPASLR